MNFIEWPGKNQFIPLPGNTKVVKQTADELEVEGSLPDTESQWDRVIWMKLTATDGRLHHIMRYKYRCKAKKRRWVGANHNPVEYVGTVGYGGIRAAHKALGYLMQDIP